MRVVFLFIQGLCVFLLSLLPNLSPDVVNNTHNLFIKEFFSFLVQHKLACVISFGLYIFFYTLFPKWIFPWQAKEKFLKSMVERINAELLDGNSEEHRVTLFKKTNYCMASLVNFGAFFCNFFSEERWRAGLNFRFLRFGDYLVIRKRCAMYHEKSTTMFRIDKNEHKNNGVASYIICGGTSLLVEGLPDINDVDFCEATSLRNVSKKRVRDVTDYMRGGHIKDFNTLKLIRRKARHFYGTIITKKDGTPWGVLLVDSTSANSPFTTTVKERFNSFAKTVCAIVNLET